MYTFVTPYKPDDHTLFHRLAILYKWPQADLRCKSTKKYGFFFYCKQGNISLSIKEMLPGANLWPKTLLKTDLKTMPCHIS